MVIHVGGLPLVLSFTYMGKERRTMPDDLETAARQTETRVVLSKDTLVPLGLVVAACASLFSAYLWLQSEFAALREHVDSKIHGLEQSVQGVNSRLERIEAQASDRWTETDMRLWVLEFARRNPRLQVPDARHHGFPDSREPR